MASNGVVVQGPSSAASPLLQVDLSALNEDVLNMGQHIELCDVLSLSCATYKSIPYMFMVRAVAATAGDAGVVVVAAGGCAVLCCAVLCCAVLCCAVLCCAVLCCAVLCCAVPVLTTPDHELGHGRAQSHAPPSSPMRPTPHADACHPPQIFAPYAVTGDIQWPASAYIMDLHSEDQGRMDEIGQVGARTGATRCSHSRRALRPASGDADCLSCPPPCPDCADAGQHGQSGAGEPIRAQGALSAGPGVWDRAWACGAEPGLAAKGHMAAVDRHGQSR
jgi:hypothetical protein